MRWYVSRGGKTVGPIDEAQIVESARAGDLSNAFVRDEAGGTWTSITDSPFAPLLGAAPAPIASSQSSSRQYPARARPTQARPVRVKKPLDPAVKLTPLVLGLLVLALALGWLGLLVGIALVAWGEVTRRKNTRSLVAWVFNAPANRNLSIATIGLGLVVSTCSAVRVGQGISATAAKRRLVDAENQAQAKKVEARAKHRAELEASIPARQREWRAAIAAGKAAAASPQFDEAALPRIGKIEESIRTFTKELGLAQPPGLAPLAAEVKSVRDSLSARQNFEQALASIPQSLAAAQSHIGARNWLQADLKYEAAASAVEKVDEASDALKAFLPSGFNVAAKRTEIQGLRRRIAGPVAAERAELDHQARMEKIDQVKSTLDSRKQATYTAAKASLEGLLTECGQCKTATTLRTAIREIDSAVQNWPIDISSIQEMQTRYADLRGRKVRVKGRLSTSTYYNCRFASQNDWRSFQISDEIIGGVHLYCSRSSASCESIFERLASGKSEPGVAVVEYPTSNYVCEEGQAYLREWAKR